MMSQFEDIEPIKKILESAKTEAANQQGRAESRKQTEEQERRARIRKMLSEARKREIQQRLAEFIRGEAVQTAAFLKDNEIPTNSLLGKKNPLPGEGWLIRMLTGGQIATPTLKGWVIQEKPLKESASTEPAPHESKFSGPTTYSFGASGQYLGEDGGLYRFAYSYPGRMSKHDVRAHETRKYANMREFTDNEIFPTYATESWSGVHNFTAIYEDGTFREEVIEEWQNVFLGLFLQPGSGRH